MEANAYDNNAEINHTWELKCQHCQSCQQCGLFRRLILDLVTQGGARKQVGIVGERQNSGCFASRRRRLLLLTAFAMFIVNRERWLVVPQVLVEWATAAQGQNHFRLYVFFWPRRQDNPSDRSGAVRRSFKLRVHGGNCPTAGSALHFNAEVGKVATTGSCTLQALFFVSVFVVSSGQWNCRAPVFILYTCLDI